MLLVLILLLMLMVMLIVILMVILNCIVIMLQTKRYHSATFRINMGIENTVRKAAAIKPGLLEKATLATTAI